MLNFTQFDKQSGTRWFRIFKLPIYRLSIFELTTFFKFHISKIKLSDFECFKIGRFKFPKSRIQTKTHTSSFAHLFGRSRNQRKSIAIDQGSLIRRLGISKTKKHKYIRKPRKKTRQHLECLLYLGVLCFPSLGHEVHWRHASKVPTNVQISNISSLLREAAMTRLW